MKKPSCLHCHTQPYTKNLHTIAEIDEFSRYFPTDPPTTALRYADPWNLGCCGALLNNSSEGIHFTIEGLAPGSIVLYFATSPSKDVMDDKTKAYNKCRNQGMRKAGKNGSIKGYLYCPSVYVNPNDGKAHPRHIHYTVWDKEAKAWSRQLRTLQIFARVGSVDRLKKFVDHEGFILVDARPHARHDARPHARHDARPAEYYDESHIPGALSLPCDEEVTAKKVKALLKKNSSVQDWRLMKDHWRHVPMILYCQNEKCNASERLKAKLDKIGVVNTWHFAEGIEGWN